MRYITWDYDNRIAIEYKRNGECNMCGKCCLAHIEYKTVEPIPNKDKTFGSTVGTCTDEMGMWSEVLEGENRYFIKLTEVNLNGSPCSALKNGICSLHDIKGINNLALCNLWPMSPEQVSLFSDCSYEFVEINRWEF